MNEKNSADVVIVGSGVSGCLIGSRLAAKGADVLILEAGPRVTRSHIVENFRNSPYKGDFQSPYPPAPYAIHPQYSPSNNYPVQAGPHGYPAGYMRMVGGTLWHWAGMAWRMLPSDFIMKSKYGVGRDWAVTYDELEPYYYEAEVEMGVGGPEEGWPAPRSKPFPNPAMALPSFDKKVGDTIKPSGYNLITEPVARNTRPFDGRPACAGNSNCMPICPIEAQYTGETAVRKAEKAGAVIHENCVVYKIEHDNKGRISAVLYKTPDGSSHRVKGKIFVLAANAIEIPKLLLISASSKYPDGMANSSGQVGRNLMDHPGTSVRFLSKEPMYPGRGPMRASCIPDFCDGDFRKERAAVKINLGNYSSARGITEYLLSKGIYGEKLNSMIRDYASRWVIFNSMFDILPRPENRVTVSGSFKDVLGIPYPEIHYSIDDYVDKGAAFTRGHFGKLAEIFGGTEIAYTDSYMNNNHMMGTTIMGDDPKDSVVDRDLRTHDHPNLFIASGSVMASAGTVNSTLTISALCLRLADALLKETAKG